MRVRVSTFLSSLVLAAILVPATAQAQYKRIELKILGMDCAICAHGVRVAVQKVDGVESVELSLNRAEADIRLKPDNHVALDQFRRIVKGNGFEPREARITARGTVRTADRKISFEVPGTPSAITVSQERSTATAYAQLEALASKATGGVEISGTVEQQGDGKETLIVTSVKHP